MNFLYVFNLSATMARQWCHVRLEQSNMCLFLIMAKMATRRCLSAAIEKTQYLIMKSRTQVCQEKKWGVEFSVYEKVKAAILRHLAMLQQNLTNGYLPCQTGTRSNLQTHWRRKGTDAHLSYWQWQHTPEPMPSLSQMPPAPPSDNEGAQRSQIVNLAPGYVYSNASVRCTQLFHLDVYA